jgi:hypothetical protein
MDVEGAEEVDESVREAVTAAMEAGEGREGPPAVSEEAPASISPTVEAGTEEPKATAAPETRDRDEKGRFSPRESKPVQVRPSVAAKATAPGTSTEAPTPLKAPASWKPSVRELWNGLPREVQEEALRREHEMTRTLSETADARKGYQAFQEAIRPYEGMIRAEGADPIGAVRQLLQTSVALRTAPPAHKAMLVAQMVRQFAIPIPELDAALAGIGPRVGQPAQTFRDPRVDEIIARAKAAESERDTRFQREGETKVEQFAQAHEFFDDVAEDFEMLYEARLRRNPGVEPDMEEVYGRAVALNPEISRILSQREAGKAQATDSATQRAKAAGKSVRSTPAASPSAREPKTVHDEVEALWSQYE